MSGPVSVDDLDGAIERYRSEGYRLDMIFPADDPREARMSRTREQVQLCLDNGPVGEPPALLIGSEGSPQWVRGRAGMEYHDLIPDRLGGKVIASHIRLKDGGPVPDYVHYHKIDFQVIYCKKGRIKLVYEDQGEPFWLETGDLVLQPPEIRHRVLECTAGAEVIEITSPAEHETWVEHEMELPNEVVQHDRLFGRTQFFRHRAGEAIARNRLEQQLVDLASSLNRIATEDGILEIVTTFSRSLGQT